MGGPRNPWLRNVFDVPLSPVRHIPPLVKGDGRCSVALTAAGRYTAHMIIPAGFAQVTLGFTGNGLPTGAVITFGVVNGAVMGAQAMADEIAVAVSDNIDPIMSSQIAFNDLLVKLGPNETGAQAVSPMSSAGSVSGAIASPQVAFLIKKDTDLGGRRGRGRMYFPGVGEADVGQTGDVDGTRRGLITAGFEDFRLTLAAADLSMVLLHDDGLTSVPVPTPVTGLSCDARVATQRRRLRR